MIQFIVYGEPTAQGRPRGTVLNGRVKMYDPAKSADYKKYVGLIASQHRPSSPIESAVSLTVKVFRPIPKLSKIKHKQAIDGVLRPISKPDLSNYIKGVEDAIEGILLKNDSQVIDYGDSGKWYGEVPRIEITINLITEVVG
jgi:Holliday junction resolvase RusA-like endonuclease